MYNVFLVPRMEERRSLHPLLKQDLPLCPYHDYYHDYYLDYYHDYHLKVFTRDKHWQFILLLLSLPFQKANRRLTVNASAGAHLPLVSGNVSRRLVNFSTGAYLSFVLGNRRQIGG